MELKAQLDDLEKLIDSRAIEKFDDSYTVMNVDKNKMLESLKNSKSAIKKEHNKAKKLWKEAMDAYYEYMKKHMGSQQIQLPEKPILPDEYHTIDGYINLFEALKDDELRLSLSFLEKIYLKTSKGITSAKSSTAYLAAYCSGSALGVSDFSLNSSRGDIQIE